MGLSYERAAKPSKSVTKGLLRGLVSFVEGISSYLGLGDEFRDAVLKGDKNPQVQAANLVKLYNKYAQQFNAYLREHSDTLEKFANMYGISPTIDAVIGEARKAAKANYDKASSNVEALQNYDQVVSNQSNSLLGQNAGTARYGNKQKTYTNQLEKFVKELEVPVSGDNIRKESDK